MTFTMGPALFRHKKLTILNKEFGPQCTPVRNYSVLYELLSFLLTPIFISILISDFEMETYAQFATRPQFDFFNRQPGQKDDRPSVIDQQPHVPPFRPILPPPPQVAHSRATLASEERSDMLTPSSRSMSVTFGGTPMVQPQCKPMSSITEGLVDNDVRNHNNAHPTHHQARSVDSETLTSWTPMTQNPDMPAIYTQPTSEASQLSSQYSTSGFNSDLPPLRNINYSDAVRNTPSYCDNYNNASTNFNQVSREAAQRMPQTYNAAQNTFSHLDLGDTRPSWYLPGLRSYDVPYFADYPGPNHTTYTGHHIAANQNGPNVIQFRDETPSLRCRKRRGNLPRPLVDILRTWFHENLDHPYPSDEDKQLLMQRTGLTLNQVKIPIQCYHRIRRANRRPDQQLVHQYSPQTVAIA